ncbi:TIGR03086 family metal-binding protein [Acidothermaceae bacterium B102]|nr:TIGR03086 family metal-binding protein [Acidothermaceae bacterium B102]
MSDIDVLEGVLAKLEDLVAGVRPDQLDDPTPCPDFDVRALIDHIVDLLGNFASGAQGQPVPDVGTYDPVKAVHVRREQIIDGWRRNGTDRDVSVMGSGPGMPGGAVLGLTIMEYEAHGSDLAMATGQAIPFTDDELGVALARGEATLQDDYRGDAFGPRLDVPADAPVRERFLGFMGRKAPVN